MDIPTPAEIFKQVSFDNRPSSGACRVISCARNPFDISPVLEALDKRLDKQPPARPLVILMGEEHIIPAHKVLRQAIIQHLCSRSKVAYGMERSHNLLDTLISKSFGLNSPLFGSGYLKDRDPEGHYLIEAFIGAAVPVHSPVTALNLMTACRDMGISVRANDAAKIKKDGHFYLDAQDPLTAQYLELLQADHPDDISVHDQQGIALRNFMIVENALAHMQESGAHVYVQDCGMGHMLGYKNNRTQAQWLYQDSLSALFKAHDIDVLPIFPSLMTFQPENLCDEGLHSLDEGAIIVTDMNEQRLFSFMPSPDMEDTVLQKMAQCNPATIKIHLSNQNVHSSQLKEKAATILQKWIDQLGSSPSPSPASLKP